MTRAGLLPSMQMRTRAVNCHANRHGLARCWARLASGQVGVGGTRGEAKVEDHKIVQRNLALQREWYGEPLGDRVRRLVVAFDISQAYLADVLGISAPMLSQVMSGRRAKIGNPAVLARLIMLERKVLVPDVAAGKKDAMMRALEEVRASRPSVTRDNLPVDIGRNDRVAVAALRRVAESADLTAAATLLNTKFPELADLLRRAGQPQ
jgi:predicted XRE-type DNA-binding protein